MIIVVTKIWIPDNCVIAAASPSGPAAERAPAVLPEATMPIAIGNVNPANPGENGKEKKSGSLVRINSSEASTQIYRKPSSAMFSSSYTLT